MTTQRKLDLLKHRRVCSDMSLQAEVIGGSVSSRCAQLEDAELKKLRLELDGETKARDSESSSVNSCNTD
jgi:hypothetical protein